MLLLRTINLEQANGNYEEQIDQMQGISECYDTIICSEKVCNYSFTLYFITLRKFKIHLEVQKGEEIGYL